MRYYLKNTDNRFLAVLSTRSTEHKGYVMIEEKSSMNPFDYATTNSFSYASNFCLWMECDSSQIGIMQKIQSNLHPLPVAKEWI